MSLGLCLNYGDCIRTEVPHAPPPSLLGMVITSTLSLCAVASKII